MNSTPPVHTMLTMLTIQIGKTQLMLRDVHQAKPVDPDRLVAYLEEIERLSWRLTHEVVAIGDSP